MGVGVGVGVGEGAAVGAEAGVGVCGCAWCTGCTGCGVGAPVLVAVDWVELRTEPPADFLISSMRSAASAALTLPFAAWLDSSCSACTRWTTAGLPILARWPLMSCESMGADSPRTAARRAWFRPRSSMRRRKSTQRFPYQLR
ncbi:hypothetical protein SANTM175S_06562 [Streptomyces antimycoticus]